MAIYLYDIGRRALDNLLDGAYQIHTAPGACMYYKFLNKCHIPTTVKGQFRFGRLRYYQLLEMVTGDEWIGDRHDGLGTTNVTIRLEGNPGEDALRKRLSDARIISAGSETKVSITGLKIINEIDCFVFCFSKGDLNQLVENMCSAERADYAYDGCLQLKNPEEIRRRRWNEGKVEGRPLNELFEIAIFDEVRYDGKESEFVSAPIAPADPFVKLRKYTSQQEWRFVLKPRTPIDLDNVTVICNGCAELLIEEVIPAKAMQARRTGEFASHSEDELLAEIAAIWRRWKTDSMQQNFIDKAERLAAERQAQEILQCAEKEMAEKFDVEVRGRLQRAYFELRSKPRALRSTEIDRAIIRGFSPGSLLMAFGRAGAPFNMLR
jgi:hypothetical protein